MRHDKTETQKEKYVYNNSLKYKGIFININNYL